MPEQTALDQNPSQAPQTIVISTQTVISEIKEFFLWWYLEMPMWYVGLIQRVATICDDTLSISLLLKTFFVPWHRDKSWTGYFFGIILRIFYIPLASLITAIILIVLLAIACAWALLPFLAIYFILKTPFLG